MASQPTDVTLVERGGVPFKQPISELDAREHSTDKDMGGNDILDTGKIRLTSNGNLTLTSINHAFQIGDDASVNLGITRNSIQARNNGGTNTLAIQPLGGIATFGGNVTVAHGAPNLIIQDTTGAGNAAQGNVIFRDDTAANIATIGVASAGNSDVYMRPLQGDFQIQPNYGTDAGTYTVTFSNGTIDFGLNTTTTKIAEFVDHTVGNVPAANTVTTNSWAMITGILCQSNGVNWLDYLTGNIIA